jgi:hypothetical protein
MGNKIEDDLWTFIAARRSLKLPLLTLAVLGIVNSSYDVIATFGRRVGPELRILVAVSPPSAIKSRYACLFEGPQLLYSGEFTSASPNIPSEQVKLPYHNTGVQACAARFNFTPQVRLLAEIKRIYPNLPKESYEEILRDDLQRHLILLESHLQRTDPAGYHLLRLAFKLTHGLVPRGDRSGNKLDAWDTHMIDAAKYEQCEAERALGYRLPRFQDALTRPAGAEELRQGLGQMIADYAEFFGFGTNLMTYGMWPPALVKRNLGASLQ